MILHKYIINLSFLASMASLGAVSLQAKTDSAPQLLWQLSEGLDRPESVYFEPISQDIFVSNIAGEPNAKDGRGWISRLNSAGLVLDAQWLANLNAPKGLRSFGDTLWLADIDRLIGVSIKDAKILFEFTLPDAKFLNDVAVDLQGNVYVSDFTDNKIYRSVRTASASYLAPEVFLAGDDLRNPNGLLFVRNSLYIGRWGQGRKADFSTEIPGSLVRNSPLLKSLQRVTADFANIDGLEYQGDGKFLVSDFIKGLIFRIDRHGNSKLILVDKPGAADIGYIPSRRILLVPNSNESVLKAYKL